MAAPTIAPTDVVLPLEELVPVLVGDGATGEVVAEGDEAWRHVSILCDMKKGSTHIDAR